MNDTTRRHPRTVLEAWPNRHPYCVERPQRHDKLMGALLAIALGLGFGACVAIWWAGV